MCLLRVYNVCIFCRRWWSPHRVFFHYWPQAHMRILPSQDKMTSAHVCISLQVGGTIKLATRWDVKFSCVSKSSNSRQKYDMLSHACDAVLTSLVTLPEIVCFVNGCLAPKMWSTYFAFRVGKFPQYFPGPREDVKKNWPTHFPPTLLISCLQLQNAWL